MTSSFSTVPLWLMNRVVQAWFNVGGGFISVVVPHESLSVVSLSFPRRIRINSGCDLRFGYQQFVGFPIWVSTVAVIWVLVVVVERVFAVWDFWWGFFLGLGICLDLGLWNVLVCDWLYSVWQNHLYVMLLHNQRCHLFQSLHFRYVLLKVQRRFYAVSKSDEIRFQASVRTIHTCIRMPISVYCPSLHQSGCLSNMSKHSSDF